MLVKYTNLFLFLLPVALFVLIVFVHVILKIIICITFFPYGIVEGIQNLDFVDQ